MKHMITIAKVQDMNPCKDRFNNFVDNNPDFKGSVEDFLSLENITYSDKVWVCMRLMTRNQKFYWARSCAYSVLEIFETVHPRDKCVRELHDYLATIDDVETLTHQQLNEISRLRSAAAYAANAAYADDAAYAAYANAAANAANAANAAANAANAAANAAYDVDDAAYAAAYAANAANAANAAYAYANAAANAANAAANAAYDVDDAAYAAAYAAKTQEEFNLIILAHIMNLEI